ncbi:hypothetical protein DL240_12990 [Lujinxingia litoralis]|uniref:DUF4870 domain-containing protein n=1 Tax=Lujinxingia litoralis TaxID=2211119 RepID=A0A328C632_9DELT|nr:hypothetical protein [Lujinxingia litoralis]RAL21761.1 hypothetical protein DL240_12990 [Lujinxingia litoralis]
MSDDAVHEERRPAARCRARRQVITSRIDEAPGEPPTVPGALPGAPPSSLPARRCPEEALGQGPRRFLYFDREKGAGLAVLSYCSVLFGVPFFIVPLVLRDNPFTLHHAKAAGAVYLVCYSLLLLATVHSALFLPLALVAYIPAWIGMYRAAAGREAGQAALGRPGERIFKWIQPR